MPSIVDAMLADLCRDPRAALDRRPAKRDRDGRELERESVFSALDIRRGRHISGRAPIRKTLTRPGLATRPGDTLPGARVEDLVDQVEHRSLAAMEDADLRTATLAESPWSDDYWPVYLGGLGQRYADPRFPLALDWASFAASATPATAMTTLATFMEHLPRSTLRGPLLPRPAFLWVARSRSLRTRRPGTARVLSSLFSPVFAERECEQT